MYEEVKIPHSEPMPIGIEEKIVYIKDFDEVSKAAERHKINFYFAIKKIQEKTLPLNNVVFNVQMQPLNFITDFECICWWMLLSS